MVTYVLCKYKLCICIYYVLYYLLLLYTASVRSSPVTACYKLNVFNSGRLVCNITFQLF